MTTFPAAALRISSLEDLFRPADEPRWPRDERQPAEAAATAEEPDADELDAIPGYF